MLPWVIFLQTRLLGHQDLCLQELHGNWPVARFIAAISQAT